MYGDQKSSIQAAADAAQKVNAMLIAKGKLKPSQLTQNTPKPRLGVQSTNTIFAEVCINDVPSQVRNMLTRGSTQEEISKNSSAAVATRGRYMTEEDKLKFPNEKPLYLSVQGPDQYSVDAAVRRIHQMIESHLARQDVYKENRFLRQMEGFGIPSSRLTDTAPMSIASGLMLSSRLDTNPMLSSRLESPLLSSRLDTSSILSNRLDAGSILSKRLDSGSILSSRLDTSPMLSSRLDTSPMLSSRLDTSPMLSSRLDTSPMLSSRRDSSLSGRLDVGRLSSSRVSSSLSINTRPSVNSLLLEDKIYVGMEGAPESFALKDKILGPGGSYLGHIAMETGAKVMLRGKGSGHLETSAGLETPEPMHIYLQHERITGLQQSKDLANNLLQTIRDEYQSQMLAMVHVPGLSTVPIISGSGVVSVTNVLSSGGMAAPTLQQQTLLPPASSGVLLVPQADALQQQALLPGQSAILLPEGQLQVPNMPPQQIVQVAPPHHSVGVPPAVVHPTPMGTIQAPLGAQGGAIQGMPPVELTQEQKLLQLQLEALKQQQTPHAPPVSVAASMAPPTGQPGLAPPQILQATPTGQLQPERKAQIPQIGPINVPPPMIVPASMQHQVIHPGLAAQQPGMAPVQLQGQPQPGMAQPQTVIAQQVQLQGQPQPGMPAQTIHQVQVMPPPVTGVPPPPNSMAPAPVPQPVAPALSHVTGAPVQAGAPPTSGTPTTGGAQVPQSQAPPTSQGLSYDQYRKVDKERRRFTEEKDDEVKVPENLLGYQHGPPHLAKLTTPTPSTATPTESKATPTSSTSKKDNNTTTATEQDKSNLKRTSSSGTSDASTAKKAKDGATPTSSSETIESREDVRLSDSKLHKMVSRSSFNQYSGQPQLYQPPQSEQPYQPPLTADQYAPTSSAPHQFPSSVAPQYSAPPPAAQYAQAPQYATPTSVGAPYSQPPPVQQVGVSYSQPPSIVQNPAYSTQSVAFSQLPQVQAQYQQPPPVLQSVGTPYAQPTVQPPYSAAQQYSAPQAQYDPGQYVDSTAHYPVHSAPYSASSYQSFSQAPYAAFSQAGAQQAFPVASQANGGSRYVQDYQAGYAERPRYQPPY